MVIVRDLCSFLWGGWLWTGGCRLMVPGGTLPLASTVSGCFLECEFFQWGMHAAGCASFSHPDLFTCTCCCCIIC